MQSDRSARLPAIHFAYAGLLTLFSVILYLPIFNYNTFGPETAMFYLSNDGYSFREMLRSYTYTTLMWYRPTGFSLPYWFLQKFFDWHDLAGWKMAHFVTVLSSAYAIYWFAVRCLKASPLAGLLTATYFMAQPTLYAAVMEVAGFDFLHILLTVFCAGFYLLGTRAIGRRCFALTAISWLFFVVALTAKEMALATPGFLLLVSLLVPWPSKEEPPLRERVVREGLRLLPFFAILPLYYFVHLARIPSGTFFTSGPYRNSANWQMILANLRKYPLWILRFFAWADDTLSIRQYQSTIFNNLVGVAGLALVIVHWRKLIRRDRSRLLTLLLMLGWTAVFLVLPAYSGGYLWHINLTVVGYSVLFGIALAAAFEAIRPDTLRTAALAAFFVGYLILGRKDLNIELYSGTHATAFLINHSLLDHPPLPAAAIGVKPLVYIEDRLNMGPWWYGCFGNLFKFTYLRREMEEVVVPPMAAVPREARQKWLAHKNAFFFRYDEDFNWHDASDAFRISSGGVVPPPRVCHPDPAAVPAPIRIASGRGRWTDRTGIVWAADSNFDGGQVYVSNKKVAGTSSPELYQNERFEAGSFEYRFCLPDGAYRVRLKFAEIWFDSPGKRVFDVLVNGKTVLSRFDVAAQAGGPDRAIDREFHTRVQGGLLAIHFQPVVSNPKVNGIEILPLP